MAGCCADTAKGHAPVAVPASALRKSRRRTSASRLRSTYRIRSTCCFDRGTAPGHCNANVGDVRFGSLADLVAISAMSALPPKADLRADKLEGGWFVR